MSQNHDGRRWSYEDYEANRERRKNRSVLAGIGIALLIVILLAIIGLSVYGVYTFTKDNNIFAHGHAVETPSGASEVVPSAPSEESVGESSEPSSVQESASQPSESASDQPLTILDRSVAEEEEGGELSTVDIVERVRPSVVDIRIYSSYDTIRASGEGSGIIMSEDGYIITNAHVVSKAAAVNVTLDNGESLPAEIIGYDTKTDLAVIKIAATDLPVPEFGNSDMLRVGERVITIGNPGGSILAGSVAQGIVSGINRTLSDDNYATTYIQTDAAINPGNSGGALVNAYGQVVGICAAKVVKVDYESIAFAIPINEAQPVINDLIRYGHVTGRAKIGFTGQEINEALAQYNNIPTGIYIFSTEEGSDIAEKGINRGDIITNIDGRRIEGFSELSKILAQHKPGDTIRLTIYRPAYGVGQTESTFETDIILMEETD